MTSYRFLRWACAIPDPESSSVVVTGGIFTHKIVSRYGRKGWIEDMKSLNKARFRHGCGSYISNGQRVRYLEKSIFHIKKKYEI